MREKLTTMSFSKIMFLYKELSLKKLLQFEKFQNASRTIITDCKFDFHTKY